MPIHIVLTTPQELFANALNAARELSERIVNLSDLTISPLAPGETADARRHQIAKYGKKLAEAFLAIDKLLEQAVADIRGQTTSDVTAGAPKPSEPDPNAN